MSINFNDPMNKEARSVMHRLFGTPVAEDETTALFNTLDNISSGKMKQLANVAKQPATLEISGDGDIKEMSDGTRYRCTPKGWVKL